MWFEKLTGFREGSPEQVRKNIEINGSTMTSLVNGRTWRYGMLSVPSLEELRQKAGNIPASGHNNRLSEYVGDVRDLLNDPANENAVFQVASQFNLLEMTGPDVTPEQGIDIYEKDRTQGPICAMAAGAGTIYRNYFVPLEGQQGQTRDRQINCLADIGKVLGNENGNLWVMKNGYVLPLQGALEKISERIDALSDSEYEALSGLIRVGVQYKTEVTTAASGHLITQVFCSALPISYNPYPKEEWKNFSRLVLRATYEATLLSSVINSNMTGSKKLFLTLVGGGAFGNPEEWIADAMAHAIQRCKDRGMEITIVSYNKPSDMVNKLISDLKLR